MSIQLRKLRVVQSQTGSKFGSQAILTPIKSKVVDVFRPTEQEAHQLLAALTQCDFAAQAVIAEMKNNIMMLKDAELEARTALYILTASNRNASASHLEHR